MSDLGDTSKLKAREKDRLKDEIGEFIIDSILEDASKQTSSVSGKKWKGLSEKYKGVKSKLSSSVIANLELNGDMLDALEYRKYRDGVEVGIFDSEEAQKSDNHNKFSAKSKKTALPKRQFLPNKNEKFRPGIVKELKKIIKEEDGSNEN